jgi:O-antigen/teichoic acid export membrane protein
VSTLALALNVALNLLWIPRYGYRGAAYSTLATEVAYFLMTALALRSFGHRIGWPSLVAKPFLATAGFAVVLQQLLPRSALLASAAASLAFVLATLLLRVWDAQEWRALTSPRAGAGASPPPG